MKKRIKISYNAPVILSFVIICFVATALNYVIGKNSIVHLFATYHGSWLNPFTYLRLLTHVFVHIDFEHFLGNSMYLLLLGPMLEEKYGSKTLLKVIICTAITTGIVHSIIFPNILLCGASGVVFACIVLSSFTTFKNDELPFSFLLVALLFIGKEMVNGIMIDDQISNLSHIIGGIIGSICGYNLNRKR